MSLQNRLILFFSITSFGSALSSISAFLSIENYFQSIIFLGIALSARTLASAIFSYFANRVIQKLGFYGSLIVSQVFGCLSLIILFLGFHLANYPLTILGIVLTGLPSTFVAILISITLRIFSQDSETFRKYSGRRELVFGIALLLSSIIAPLLLYKFNLNFILSIDAISYLLGIILVMNIKVGPYSKTKDDKQFVPLNQLLFKSYNVNSFLIKTSSSLLLAGLLPIFASSGNIQFTMDLSVLLRQWLWSIEDITAISASVLYLIFVILRRQKWFEFILMLNGVWLIIPLIFDKSYSVIFATVIICLLTDFSGQKFRDDLVVSAGENVNLIQSHSAIAQLQRNFVFFLSPILLSILLAYVSSVMCVVTIILIQSILVVTKIFLIEEESHYKILEENELRY